MNYPYLDTEQVLLRLGHALEARLPFSLVRMGDGENLVLAQDTVWPVEDVLKERWAIKANKGQKGLTLPNYALRDAVREAIGKADVVGILPHGDSVINAPEYLKRQLTDQIFQYYSLSPKAACHACINRDMVYTQQFWSLITGQRIVLVTREAETLRQKLVAPPYSLTVVHALPFAHYGYMEETLQWLSDHRDAFDLVLFTCGVNAVVLAQKTAELTGKVALDFGKAASIITKGSPN
ncbi:MAG: hypothetical protein K0R57_2692 [Paenibacillaceae bacterium]|jgi:hypothetical protein|nr:hypothetical protein [Paenibacillaceae bacterium]